MANDWLSTTTAMEQPEVLMMVSGHCVWTDPTTEFKSCLRVHRTMPQKYGKIVRNVTRQVINNMNKTLGSSPSGISDILHNVISCAWRDNFEIPAGCSCRRFGGWDFSPPNQRCSLSQKMASKLKKTSFFEYTFSFCILILSKNEYTTFFQKIPVWPRHHRIWVRATCIRNPCLHQNPTCPLLQTLYQDLVHEE